MKNTMTMLKRCAGSFLTIAATLALPMMTEAQGGYPCNTWVDRVVNSSAPEGDATGYTRVLYGYEKIIYVNNSTDQMANIYGSTYQNYGYFNTSSTDVSEYSDIRRMDDGIVYMGNDSKFYIFSWNGTNWVSSVYNNYIAGSSGSEFAIDDPNRIFYYGASGDIYNVFGSNSWEVGPLNTAAPNGSYTGEIALGGDRVYYTSSNNIIYYYYWTVSGWSWARANQYAQGALDNSPLIYDNGTIYYIGNDQRVRYISGSGFGDHGIVSTSAPLASPYENVMRFDNGKLVYINQSERFQMLQKVGSSWNTYQIHASASPGFTRFDFVDGRGIAYASDVDNKIHELVLHACPPEEEGLKTFLDNEYEAAEVSELNIFPNPATAVTTIQTPTEFMDGQVEVMDLSGRMVYSAQVNPDEQVQLDLSAYSPGVYMVKFSSSLGTKSYKLVKE